MAEQVVRKVVRPIDVVMSSSPVAAVCAGFFLARSRVADRGALRVLSLGFGALAPRRQGEPSRCRRCQGPLPGDGLGGVVQCRYCDAENIEGLDLRPIVDKTRSEAKTFDRGLGKHRRERRVWRGLGLAGLLLFALWGWTSSSYARDPRGPLERWPTLPELGDP